MNPGLFLTARSKSAMARAASAFGAISETAVVERDVVFRRGLERLAEIRDRAVEVAAVLMDQAAIVERDGVARIELDGAAEVGERAVEIAAAAIGGAAAVVDRCEVEGLNRIA